MSDFTYNPSYGASRKRKPRARVASFGDGYEQRTGDGINVDLAVWDITFQNRSATDADAIETFLALKAAVTAFTWTPVGMSEITVVCRSWQRGMAETNKNTITATFEQVLG